jgi:sec-independent protein translocase protein TatB
VVALIAIGPKDMPVAIKAMSDTIKKLRRMAGEFQGHVDEMIRDADLGAVKSTFDELRGLNLKQTVQRAIDPDSTLRGAFSDPFRDRPVRPVMAPLDQPPLPCAQIHPVAAEAPAALPAPAFIPPNAVPPAPVQPDLGAAPAFIPPKAVDQAASDGARG